MNKGVADPRSLSKISVFVNRAWSFFKYYVPLGVDAGLGGEEGGLDILEGGERFFQLIDRYGLIERRPSLSANHGIRAGDGRSTLPLRLV